MLKKYEFWIHSDSFSLLFSFLNEDGFEPLLIGYEIGNV